MLGELRYLIELRVVRRMLGEMIGILIELRVVRSLLENCEVFDRVGVVRRMLGEM